MYLEFRCKCCGQVHEGIPAFHADRPDQYWDVPESKRNTNVFLSSDSCVIADRFFFIHGCIEIPIIGTDKVFTWGVWVSLKEENFLVWQEHYETPQRSQIGPFFGWLSTRIPVYPDTMNLKTMAHLRDDGIRPYIELDQSDHPLAVDQHGGITFDCAMEIVHRITDPAGEQRQPERRPQEQP